MRGFGDADAQIAKPSDGRIGRAMESVGRLQAQVGAVVLAADTECDSQFAGTRTQCFRWLGPGAGFFLFYGKTSAAHGWDAAGRLQGADKDKAVFPAAFDQDVEEPIHPVIEIDVSGAGVVFGNKCAGGWSRKGVRSFVTRGGIGLGFDDEAGAGTPDELAADEFAGACDGIALEEGTWKQFSIFDWRLPIGVNREWTPMGANGSIRVDWRLFVVFYRERQGRMWSSERGIAAADWVGMANGRRPRPGYPGLGPLLVFMEF